MTNQGLPITIDGKEYQLTQLGQKDWDYLTNCMRAEYVAAYDCDNEVRMASIRREAFAMDRDGLVTWFDSIAGTIRLVWVTLRAAHPDLTIEQVGAWVLARLVDLRKVYEVVTMGRSREKGDGGSQAPNAPPQKNGKPRKPKPTQP